MLVDNHGHAYQMKRDNVLKTVHWRCRYNKPLQSCKHSLRQIYPISVLYTSEPLNRTHVTQSLESKRKSIVF